jgi:hypothetical protein
MKTTKLIEETITIKVEELFEEVILEECETVWRKNITTKLNVSTNYYNLSVDDREKILTLMKDWATKELMTVSKIKTNNRTEV